MRTPIGANGAAAGGSARRGLSESAAINFSRVVWQGAEVTDAAASLLLPGAATLRVNSPSSVAGFYPLGEAQFGPPLSTTPRTGTLVAAIDPSDANGASTLDACSPLTNPGAVNAKIALIDRGTCGFTVKVKNAQNGLTVNFGGFGNNVLSFVLRRVEQ